MTTEDHEALIAELVEAILDVRDLCGDEV